MFHQSFGILVPRLQSVRGILNLMKTLILTALGVGGAFLLVELRIRDSALEGELNVIEALVELGHLLGEEVVHLVHWELGLWIHGAETTLATSVMLVRWWW